MVDTLKLHTKFLLLAFLLPILGICGFVYLYMRGDQSLPMLNPAFILGNLVLMSAGLAGIGYLALRAVDQDAIKHKQNEEMLEVRRLELKRQIALLQSTLESIGQGFAVWDAERRLVVWNSKCIDFWYKPDNVCVGTPMIDILQHIATHGGFGPGDAVQLAYKRYQSLLDEENKLWEDEFTLMDGRVIHVDRYPMPENAKASVYTDITERRRIEAAIYESEARLHAILDNTSVGIWLVGVDGRYRFVNKAFSDATGIAEERFLETTNLSELLGSESAEKCLASDRASLTQDVPYISYETLTLADGKPHMVEVTKTQLLGSDGEVSGVIGMMVDITARRMAEEALRQSNERLEFALEGSGDGAWDQNVLTGESLYFKRCREMLGYVEDDIGNDEDAWGNLIHPDDLPYLMEALRLHFDGKISSFSNEQRMLCKDGSWKWILTRGKLISRDADGRPERLTGTYTDISERKLVQKLQIHAVLEASAEAKLLVRHDGVITFANSVAERYFGFPMDQLVGLNVDNLVPNDFRAGHSQRRAEFMSPQIPRTNSLSRQVTAMRQDGSEFPVELSLSPITIDNRIVVIVSAVDITERKRSEQAMVRAKESAETALARATMAEREIITISEETRERIGQELHDGLGQSLTGIAFLSEVLHTRLKKQDWPEMQLVSRITTLINDAVLNTRQLAQGLYPVELEGAGFQAMVEQLANQIRSIYRINCDVYYDENFKMEDTDVAINLFRIAQEAINNAIRHGAATRIIMRTMATSEAWIFEISDNGIGIEQDFHPEQDGSEERDGLGGLGMHTMQHRASLIGASLSFGASSDGGIAVTVNIPAQ